jgi:hypothetical protein
MSNEERNNSSIELQNRTFLDQNDNNILIVTRGHPFERDPFFEMIDSTAYPWSHIEHPAAQEYIISESIKNYKAISFL